MLLLPFEQHTFQYVKQCFLNVDSTQSQYRKSASNSSHISGTNTFLHISPTETASNECSMISNIYKHEIYSVSSVLGKTHAKRRPADSVNSSENHKRTRLNSNSNSNTSETSNQSWGTNFSPLHASAQMKDWSCLLVTLLAADAPATMHLWTFSTTWLFTAWMALGCITVTKNIHFFICNKYHTKVMQSTWCKASAGWPECRYFCCSLK